MGIKARSDERASRPEPQPAREASAPAESEERAGAILEELDAMWGHAACELTFQNPYQLLAATILSAQSTDERVNQVTPELFSRYPTPADLAGAEPEDLEPVIRSTGFYRSKAKHLVGMARALVADHGGEVPKSAAALTALPGVAEKTANVVLGTAYGIPSGFVVDTHVARVSRRLGLTSHTRPEKIARDLESAIPRDRWIDAGHEIIWHGRYLCKAKNPACSRCRLAPLCPSSAV